MTLRTGSTSLAPVQSALFAKKPGSSENWFNGKHQLNASSRVDAMQILNALMTAVQSGQVSMGDPSVGATHEETAATKRARNDLFLKAHDQYKNGDVKLWAETGAAISADVSQTSNRDGIMRRYLTRAEIPQGGLARIRLKVPNVLAVSASSPTQLQPAFVKGNYITPPEFTIKANVRITEIDIVQGSDELLDDTFLQCQEQIMVEEDRIFKNALDTTIGLNNPLQILAGGLTPTSLASLRGQLLSWGLPAQNILMASDVWADIVGNANVWGNLFDPVTQFEIVQTGFLGSILGLGITSDAYRVVQKQVFNAGEVYVLTAPEYLGVYTDRGPVQASPRDSYDDGVPARGWFFYEIMSITIANARGVVKGIRA